MKTLLLVVALLLACRPGAAQLARPASPPDTVAVAQLAAPDTVAALHRLFAAKRRKLPPLVAGTLVAMVGGVVVVSTTTEGGGRIDARTIGMVLVTMLGVVVAGTEVLFYTAYNHRHEQRAVAAFQAHQLPRHLQRQLKAKYFR